MSWNYNIFLYGGFLLPIVTTGCSNSKPDQSSKCKDDKLPNIVLIVADDHGKDALGCYGNKVIRTPNLDKLAADGIKFTNAFCTSASCSASRSALLTGMYNHAIGHYGHAHDYHHFSTYDTIKSLPVYLEQIGYITARIGKYHLAPEKVYTFSKVIDCDPRSTVEMAEKCRNIIESKPPFFLYFCFDDPHRSYPFKSDPWDAPNSFGNRLNGYKGVTPIRYQPNDVIVPSFLPDNMESRKELAEYYQSVSRIDQGVGHLINIIKENGKEDNTVIIYVSDNGIAFSGAKTTVYNPGINIPCIIKVPWLKNKGLTNEAMVSLVDITPTLLDIAKVIPEKNNFQGKSFKSILEVGNHIGFNEIYASHTFHEVTMYYPMRVVQTPEFKLIWNIAWQLPYPLASDLFASSTWQGVIRRNELKYGKRVVDNYLFRPEFELYNLISDPDEINNLVSDGKYEPILDSMKGKIKKFQIETRDPWIIMWDQDAIFQGTGENL